MAEDLSLEEVQMATIEELTAKVAELEQQMAAITAPPTEYYTSAYSGEEIDAAVKKVSEGLAGGVTSFNGRRGVVVPQAGDYNATQIPVSGEPEAETVAAALSNKAPGGYGLGTSNPRHIDDANNALESGWYYLDASTLNGPESAEYSNVMLVLTRNSNPQTVQVSFNVTDLAFELRRVCTNGVWSPWEWVNPPMQLGVEYRTTERYSNKPVFVMAVNGGGFPNSSSKKIDVQIPDTSGQVKMLDCYGVLDNGTQIPGLFGESVFDASNYLGLLTQNGNGKFTISVGSGRTVGLNFTLFLKYWKEGT
jgi:hypothetical protein